MTNSNLNEWRGCPIRYASSVFGDKWNMMILRDLMFKGRNYYGDFLDAGEGISTNILADRLAKLEQNGIISKNTDPIKRSKKYYRLTNKGLELLPIMLKIIEWSQKYDEKTEVPDQFIHDLKTDPVQLQKRLLNDLSYD